MSAITQLVVAKPSDAKVLLDSENPLESCDGFAYTGLDRVRLITLWALAESLLTRRTINSTSDWTPST